VGASAALVEVPPGTGAAWRDLVLALAERGALPAPRDVVPAEATLLVDGVDPSRLVTALRDADGPVVGAGTRGEVVEIPTVYDGADLDTVAELWGTDRAGVVARHTGRELQVAFCGFAPGFPYLLGLDAPVPRLATPRTTVPAGSVALAGPYCGIYPSDSPGGWQLIGRTATRLFDAEADPPALLPPGTRVRFRQTAELEVTGPDEPPREPGGPDRRPGLVVVRAGALTTVQDLGRPGLAHLGVPRAGALDEPAARLANRLVGNDESGAVLETTRDGVALRAERATTVAVTGATAPVYVDGQAAEWGVALDLLAGATVEVGRALTGVRSYLAVAGGIDVAPVLGSRSTDTLAHLGPPRLRAGDRLPVAAATGAPPRHVDFSVPRRDGPVVLRLRPGPRDDRFGPAGLASLAASTYVVSPSSNRVGARLTGPALERLDATEVASEGMVLGAVQVPPDGLPVVFLADHPTTGGYPVIGVVEPADLAALAQARPGGEVRFSLLGNRSDSTEES
jgi:KipI family sensor histidine kinase inhibitor